jgi:D-lactate dehydrogenase (cytochrome)
MELTSSSLVDPRAVESAFADLQPLLGSRISNADIHREHHSHGESYHLPAPPDLVCYPQTTQEVSTIMKVSARYKIPVIPYGAGTSVEGNVNALRGGIAIDLREMNKISRVSVEDCDATVEAGVTRLQLIKALNNTGLTFFIDPGADATIGGMASTRASGTTAVAYGTMSENVLGLTVVLADGRIIHTGSRARKSSAGYDLTHLFIGAEGTLGVITEVILRLHPIPEASTVAVCTFETVSGAVETVIEAIQLGTALARVEYLDDKMVEAINRHSKLDLPLLPTLFFEFHGLNDRDVSEQAELIQELCSSHGGSNFRWKKNLEDKEELWAARHNAYFAARAMRPGAEILSTDVCVPISRLAECITATRDDLGNVSFPATMVGHVGDGNFHVLCAIDPKSSLELQQASDFSNRLVQRALSMAGTSTGEHGVGIGKMKYLVQEHGDAVEVMRTIKSALDPENRMNTGKILEID